MSRPFEPLPPVPPLDRRVAEATKRALRQERALQAQATRSPRSERWRPRWVAAGVLVAGVATTAATAYAAFRTAPAEVVHCYAVESRDVSRDYPGGDISVFAAGGASRPDPVDQCALLWRDGVLRPGSTDTHEPQLDRQADVPVLEACVTPDGLPAVFPATGACARLDLAGYVAVDD